MEVLALSYHQAGAKGCEQILIYRLHDRRQLKRAPDLPQLASFWLCAKQRDNDILPKFCIHTNFIPISLCETYLFKFFSQSTA